MKCKICLSKSELIYTKVKSIYNNQIYQIYNCNKCNLAFTNYDTESNTELIYKDTYDYDVNEIVKSEKIWRLKNNFSKIKHKVKLNNNSKILDIGCMHGYLLDFLNKTYKSHCDGLEIENFYSKSLMNKNIKIFKQNLKEFASDINNLNKYDFIILSHSLEHFENPAETIKIISTLLKKNGHCYIAVPNFESKISILVKKNWGWLQPSVHYFHYKPSGLIKLFEESDFNLNVNFNQGGDTLFLLLTFYNIYNHFIGSSKKLYKKSYIKKIIIKITSILFKYIYYIGDDESLFLFEKK